MELNKTWERTFACFMSIDCPRIRFIVDDLWQIYYLFVNIIYIYFGLQLRHKPWRIINDSDSKPEISERVLVENDPLH